MNISAVIEKLGYRPNEVKIYLAALEEVESTASGIAVKAKLPLSSAQIAIERLHKDGLMNFYSRKHRKYWTAEHPQKLMQILKEKEAGLSSVLEKIKSKERIKGKPEVEVFIGADEIKLIHKNMLEKKRHIRAIIPWEAWSKMLGQDYLNDFINLRVKYFLNMRMLVPRTPSTLKLKNRDSKELRQTKFLPESMIIEDALFIFNDN